MDSNNRNVWESMISMMTDAKGKVGDKFVPLAVIVVEANLEAKDHGTHVDSSLGVIWPNNYPKEGRALLLAKLAMDYIKSDPEPFGDVLVGTVPKGQGSTEG